MWKDLSIQQKSEVMKMAISQGLTDLNEIKRMYDASIPNIEASSVNNTYSSVPYNPSPKDVRYDDGGMLSEVIITPDRDYNVFLNSLPPNQRYGDGSFNTYRYWELHGKPTDFEAALKTNPPMYTLEDDGYYHADSVAYNKDNDTYEFMKSPDHPTVDLELLQYWNNPDLEEFRNNYGLDLDSNPYKYIRRETTDKPLYAYGGPLGNIYKGTGNKSQKLSNAERENRAMWAKGQPFYEEMSLWNTGLSDVALAGILGNIGLESGFDYKSTKGTHYGYLQNQDSIRDYIKKYYGGYGHKEQMQYLRDGLTGKLRGRDSSIGKQMQARFDGYIKAVANVTDPIVASQLWEQHYERSKGQAMGKRQRYAKYFYEQLTPQEKQELAQQMTSPEMDYNTRFAGQLAVDPNFLYLDPSMSFFDALTKAGVHFKTSNPSGYRSPAQQKAMGFKTKDSQHSHKRDDGTAWALDIVPAKGYTFADLQRELTHPALQVYFRNNGLGVYDETTQEVLAKTGGTGPHYHVGRNKFGPKGSMAITYNNWVKKYNPALPEAYKMPIDLVEVSPEQSIYHHPANDLVWNPPTTEITPEDLNREIAPLLMQDNKPLIVEPLNNSEPSESFDDIWDQIFPKVENTQEEFNPLLDPSTQFTALQSRPRYQMKPTPIINMPTSDGDNDYMLFKPLAKGGNLFDDGSYLRNYQWRTMPETDVTYNDYNTGLPVQVGDKVWTDEQGNIVTTDSNPNAAADFAVQYRNPRFELDYPEITIEGNGKGYFTGESFADRYARELAAPIAKNANVDPVFQEQANWQYEQSKEKHEADVHAADKRAYQLTPGFGTFVAAPLAATLAPILGYEAVAAAPALYGWLTGTAAGQGLLTSTLGGEAVETLSRLAGYNSFGDMMTKNAGWGNEMGWSFANPGYLLSPSRAAVGTASRVAADALGNVKITNPLMESLRATMGDYSRGMFGIDTNVLANNLSTIAHNYELLPDVAARYGRGWKNNLRKKYKRLSEDLPVYSRWQDPYRSLVEEVKIPGTGSIKMTGDINAPQKGRLEFFPEIGSSIPIEGGGQLSVSTPTPLSYHPSEVIDRFYTLEKDSSHTGAGFVQDGTKLLTVKNYLGDAEETIPANEVFTINPDAFGTTLYGNRSFKTSMDASAGTPKLEEGALYPLYVLQGSKYSSHRGNGPLSSDLSNFYLDTEQAMKGTILEEGSPVRSAARAYVEDLEGRIGDLGTVEGSYRAVAHGLPHSPNDVEILVPESKVGELSKRLNVTRTERKSNGFGLDVYSDEFSHLPSGKAEFEVLKNGANGKAIGKNAWQLYEYLYPEEARALSEKYVESVGKKKYVKGMEYTQQELPMTAEELFDAYRNSDLADIKFLVDTVGAKRNKYVERRLHFLLEGDPKIYREAFIRKLKSVLPEAKTLEEQGIHIDYTDVEANKALLDRLKIDPKYASNPEVMQNIIEHYVATKTIGRRGISYINDGTYASFKAMSPQQRMQASRLQNVDAGGGNGSGGGVNMTTTSGVTADMSQPAFKRELEMVKQFPLTFHPEKIKTAEDVINQLDRFSNIPQEINRKIDQANHLGGEELVQKIAEENDLPIFLGRVYSPESGQYLGGLDREGIDTSFRFTADDPTLAFEPPGDFVRFSATERPDVFKLNKEYADEKFGPHMENFFSYLNTRGDRMQQKVELRDKAGRAHHAYSSFMDNLSTLGKMAGLTAAAGGGMYGLITGLNALTTPDFAELIRASDGNAADLNYIKDLAREDGYDLSLEDIKKLHDEGFSNGYLKHFLKARRIKE